MRPTIVVLAISLLACSSNSAHESEQASLKKTNAPTDSPTPSPERTPGETAALAGPSSAGGLRFEMPSPFVRRAPKSQMRAAEYTIDGEPRAELAVFYFGEGQGGSVEDNLKRWIGQFSQPDGSDSAERAKREELRIRDIPVTLIEVEGTYSGGMAVPGGAPPQPATDSMMLAAIANGPRGPVFFKLVGPKVAVQAASSSFRQGLESIRVE
jgi:hypothetical protein